ncbi:MAG: hypothetical protein PHY08_09420 [Candidatus Cloacimonetes bacterium]|jgi:hypothetical protein|nr:hypothetical protein [Candidatus Cloacimonadota bacterium]MDD4156777.1 hypothetical protein [Candidatus Cloacimonadota bacterium]
MQIKFRDVNYGIVEARATIITNEGFFINEVTILNKDGNYEIELPQKTFKAKDGKVHNLDIIGFENEDQKTLFMLQVKESFLEWRKKQRKVRVYES